jgi:hypothetical protein
MMISGSGSGEYSNKRFSWFGGQGAFADLAEAIRNLKIHKDYEQGEPANHFFTQMKDVWQQVWNEMQFDVQKKLKHPSSKAVLICTYFKDNPGKSPMWTDLLLIHPKAYKAAECRLVVYTNDSGGPNEPPFDELYEDDDAFMQSMNIKFWDLDFAAKYLTQSLAPSVSIGKRATEHSRNRWQGFYGGTPLQG